jgi:hypothetical protein
MTPENQVQQHYDAFDNEMTRLADELDKCRNQLAAVTAERDNETPETDALAIQLGHLPDMTLRDDLGASEFWTAINHARELESQLAFARRELIEMRK